jgi:hypothetical protein
MSIISTNHNPASLLPELQVGVSVTEVTAAVEVVLAPVAEEDQNMMDRLLEIEE